MLTYNFFVTTFTSNIHNYFSFKYIYLLKLYLFCIYHIYTYTVTILNNNLNILFYHYSILYISISKLNVFIPIFFNTKEEGVAFFDSPSSLIKYSISLYFLFFSFCISLSIFSNLSFDSSTLFLLVLFILFTIAFIIFSFDRSSDIFPNTYH